jgi:hypothetical protein
MENYRTILKRVGLVLIVVGVLDIAYMVYCIWKKQSYSSSLNIFAVIAGVYLLRGNLAAVRWVTWFAAFMLAGFIGAMLVLFPFMRPPESWAPEFRFHPVALFVSVIVGIAGVVLLVWVYTNLRAAPVLSARIAAGQSAAPPKLAFVLGATLVVALAIMMHFTMGGSIGAKAVKLAEAKYGSGYHYYVTRVQWSGSHYSARLTAYNDHEEKPVQIEWEQ